MNWQPANEPEANTAEGQAEDISAATSGTEGDRGQRRWRLWKPKW